MQIRIILAALALSVPASALAQAAPPVPKEDLIRVALDTDKGRIVLALDRGRAPATTANFLQYVDSGRLNGEGFYRAMKYGAGGIIQGGVSSDARKLYPAVQHEPTSQTGIKNTAWSIAMAGNGPGMAKSDFFIMTTDIPAFDATATQPGFAAFGRVVEGQEVVKAILAAPTSPTKGEGVMRGQMLEPMVKIVKAVKLDK